MSVWWLAQPFVEWAFYVSELHRGSYSANADSIVIPIGRFTIGWAVMTPVLAWFGWRVFRRAPERIGWAAFDRSRPAWSTIWTLGLSAFAISELAFAYRSISRGHPEDVASGILETVVAIGSRALICAPRREPVVRSRVAVGRAIGGS